MRTKSITGENTRGRQVDKYGFILAESSALVLSISPKVYCHISRLRAENEGDEGSGEGKKGSFLIHRLHASVVTRIFERRTRSSSLNWMFH